MMAARLEEVSKHYGRLAALDKLSFEIPQGSICALVGKNGAGKTTAMGVLAGLIRPDSGQIDLLQGGAFSVATHGGRVGIMPQDSVPSPHAPIVESLKYYARLQGLSSEEAGSEASKWLQRVHLSDRSRSKYTALSHGMRRRFSLAQAMLGTPELLLLDEPTSGLDPELVVEIRKLIVALRGKSTVLVSSHILSELQDMCDHVIFIDKGACTRQGRMSQITGRDSILRYRLANAPNTSELKESFKDLEIIWKRPILEIRAPSGRSAEDINAACLPLLLASQVGIQEISSGDTLESAYIQSQNVEPSLRR